MGEQRKDRVASEESGSGAGTSTTGRGADGGTDVGRARNVDTPSVNNGNNPVRKPVLLKEDKREQYDQAHQRIWYG